MCTLTLKPYLGNPDVNHIEVRQVQAGRWLAISSANPTLVLSITTPAAQAVQRQQKMKLWRAVQGRTYTHTWECSEAQQPPEDLELTLLKSRWYLLWTQTGFLQLHCKQHLAGTRMEAAPDLRNQGGATTTLKGQNQKQVLRTPSTRARLFWKKWSSWFPE